MKVFETTAEMRAWSLAERATGHKVGFVPTMGYLHEGHLSLVRKAREQADRVVVSIFVNPTQFGPNEDFDSYPRDTERDLGLCRELGVNAVFMPAVREMYPEGHATFVEVERLGDFLCGASRPGHFRGVTTVVSKLFHAVAPTLAVFGRKDAQQARIIQRMTADLLFDVEIVVAPIVREPDGLAMSSRNVRLEPGHRAQAPAIQHGLREARKAFRAGERDAKVLTGQVLKRIASDAPDGVVDYVELVDWGTLRPVEKVEKTALLAAAVKFGEVRLIDNTLLEM